ncbi:MAG: hypothetical protein V4696_07670 [Pseudomonadota bacterium]
MEPLLIFIAKIRAWHVLLACAAALIFVIVSHLSDKGAVPRAVSLQQSLLAMIAIPVMIFTIAFLAFAFGARDFSAVRLFPPIFLVVAVFVAVGIVGFGIEDREMPYAIVGALGFFVSLGMSILLCAAIALRQRFVT